MSSFSQVDVTLGPRSTGGSLETENSDQQLPGMRDDSTGGPSRATACLIRHFLKEGDTQLQRYRFQVADTETSFKTT